jgi:hypothetical protein
MRVRLNPRSAQQLQQVMSILGENNPTHVLQQMITTFNNSLSHQSLNEDIHDNQENQSLRAMPN